MPILVKVIIPGPFSQTFDYLLPESIALESILPGIRVTVPFGSHQYKTGIVFHSVEKSEIEWHRLKPIVAILDKKPLLSKVDIKLLFWASRYYHYPIGQTLICAHNVCLSAVKHSPSEKVTLLFLNPSCDKKMESKMVHRTSYQATLLRLLKESPDGLERQQLVSSTGDFRSAARQLVKKGLAVWQQGVVYSPKKDIFYPKDISLPLLNVAQNEAVTHITNALGQYRTFLLEGVTGSGKTEVYLRVAREVLVRGQQVMILVPEINLTPQLAARFQARFPGKIGVFHSQLSDKKRKQTWFGVQRGEIPILLGTRSAVFIPMSSIGAIFLDEEHDISFKQQEKFRFSARDVAVMRASMSKIPIVLGSATPSLESLHNVKQARYHILYLPERAGQAKKPQFFVQDIRKQRLTEGISSALSNKIYHTLERGEQAMLFINRRGFAPALTCYHCGWIAQCQACSTRLVVHLRDQQLRCHHCGLECRIPTICVHCHQPELHAQGLGTERVEIALEKLFPGVRVVRIDRDTTNSTRQLESVLGDIHGGRVDILIGTQMLAKGHHFPNVTLVGILNVDGGLYSTDFRGTEHMAQLIIQVAGRAGREERPGQVVLQTRHPDHPLLNILIQKGYSAFAKEVALERKAASFPPFAYQALWRVESERAETLEQYTSQLACYAKECNLPSLQIFGPVPAPLARRAGQYRWQLLLQSEIRAELHHAVDYVLTLLKSRNDFKQVRCTVDIDPVIFT